MIEQNHASQAPTQYATATSCINVENGIPCLYVNREQQSGLAYMTYLTDHNCYAEVAVFVDEEVYAIIATGEKALYANIMLQKGVI